jgi:hypothetical protein
VYGNNGRLRDFADAISYQRTLTVYQCATFEARQLSKVVEKMSLFLLGSSFERRKIDWDVGFGSNYYTEDVDVARLCNDVVLKYKYASTE